MFKQVELFRKIYKFLFINFAFSGDFSLKKGLFFLVVSKLYTNKFSLGLKVKFTNRCVLTNRPRGVIKKYNLSRIKLREFLQYGVLPGFVKAVW